MMKIIYFSSLSKTKTLWKGSGFKNAKDHDNPGLGPVPEWKKCYKDITGWSDKTGINKVVN